ncbi:MAG: divalent-cation tolerance protein CutA [Euryarchaeota archaeon]|nr:divalent-cation tolerance protein CutA [Euryarchaeota archaeon]
MYAVIYITAKDAEEARSIARKLVEERLAACANIIEKVTSFYWWRGRIEEDEEALIILKTLRKKVPAVVERVKQLHSYQVPEVIALEVVEGSPEYLRWLEEETRG